MAQISKSKTHGQDARFVSGYGIARRMQLDDLDAIIIKESLTNPNVSPIDIASTHGYSLSTVRRRWSRLQERFVKKKYVIDFQSLGLRTAFLTMDVHKGNVEEVTKILAQHPRILSIRHGLNSHISIMAEITFANSEELLSLITFAKDIKNVGNVGFFEILKELTTDNHGKILSAITKRSRA
jgi:DNA-binding Lrp family transcriptional regulator